VKSSALFVPAPAQRRFPAGDSRLASLIQNYDWSATDLGAIHTWPLHLIHAVNLIVLSPVPMILLWGPNGIMIYNDGYSEIAGLRHPGILGGRVLEGWPEIADFNANILRVCLAGRTLSYHNQPMVLFRNKVREQAWFNIHYSPVPNLDGHPEGVLAVIRETTEQVLTEELRGRADKALIESNHALKQANADLEQFAFSASHDLQEPLRMVSVYSQLLQRKLAGKLEPESQILLKHCIDGAMRLDNLIKDLLEYTRASSDSITDPPPVDLGSVVEHVLEILRPQLTEVSATVTTDPLPTMRIQAIHGQQIYHNLISNAIKYRSSSPLRLHIGAVQNTEKQWTFHVSDNGIGLDPAYKEQIFGLFKRLHSSSEYSGTGLGLAICKKLVDRYGGRIWVDSKLGTGSTFYFTLPLAE
jgi:signal transduction histidine kinase